MLLIHMPSPAGISKMGYRAGAVKLPGSPFSTPSLRIPERKVLWGKVCKDPGTWNDGWVAPEGNWREKQ